MIRRPLINSTIHQTPHRRANSRSRGDNTPISAEVLDAPDDGDDDGGKGEDGAVAGADGGADEPEEVAVVLEETGGEQELAEGHEEGEGDEEGYAA